MKINMKSGFTVVEAVVLVVLVVVVLAGISMAKKKTATNTDAGQVTTEPTTTPTTTGATKTETKTTTAAKTDKMADWKTATISDLGITFKYPPEWGSYDIKITGGEEGVSKGIVFSNEPSSQTYFSYASKGFTAGRSGSIAEGLSYRKVEPNKIKTCAGFKDQMKDSYKDCKTINTEAGIGIVGIINKNEMITTDNTFGVITWEITSKYPYFSIQLFNNNTSSDLELVTNILKSIQLIK